MSATPFRAISFQPNELISEDKLDQFASNQNWLYENSPRAYYTLPGGIRRQEGVKILAGRATIAPAANSDTRTVNVGFSNYFSAGCQPIVTTGIVSTWQSRIFCVINGPGNQLFPTNAGFQITVNVAADRAKYDKIKKALFINYQAIGY